MNVQTDTTSLPGYAGESLQGVVAIGRRKYAVSLIWNQAEGKKSLKDQAQEATQRVGSNFCALRPGKGAWHDQFAIGDATLGHKSWLSSLAAALADELNNSLLGVWQLAENTWWLVAIRADGSIIYDRAASNATEIQQDFFEALALGEWEQVLCPPEWNIPDSGEVIPLEGNIGAGKIRLQAIKMSKALIGIIAGATLAVLISAIAGYQAYQAYQQELAMRNANTKRSVGFEVPREIPVPAMPWAGKPLFSVATIQCIRGLEQYAEEAGSIPAWQRGTGSCSGTQVSYTVSSIGGTEAWLTMMAERLATKPSVSAGGTTGVLSWQLPDMPVYPSNSPGVSLQKVQNYLQMQLAELFIPISFQQGSKQLFWLSMKYSLTNIPNLEALLPLFKNFPASVIHSMTYNPEQGLWSLEAEIFERRKPSQQELDALIKSRG